MRTPVALEDVNGEDVGFEEGEGYVAGLHGAAKTETVVLKQAIMKVFLMYNKCCWRGSCRAWENVEKVYLR